MPPHHFPPALPHHHGSRFPGRDPGLVLPGQAPPSPPELLERRPGIAQLRESGGGREPRSGRRRLRPAALGAFPAAAGAGTAAPGSARRTRSPRVLEASGAALLPGSLLAAAGLRCCPAPPWLRRRSPAGLGPLRGTAGPVAAVSPADTGARAVLGTVPRPRAAGAGPAQPLVPGTADPQPPAAPGDTDSWERLLQEVPQGRAVQAGPEGELRRDRGEPLVPDPLLPALLLLHSRGRVPDPAEAAGVGHHGRHRRLPGGPAAPAGRGAHHPDCPGGNDQGRGGAAGPAGIGALGESGRAGGHGKGAGNRPSLPVGAGSLLHQLPGVLLPADLCHAPQDAGHAQVQPAGSVPGRGAGRVFQGPDPAPFPGIHRLLDRLLRIPGRLRLPGAPDPAGDFLPLLRGLRVPGGAPAAGRPRLPAPRDPPERLAPLAVPVPGRAPAAPPGPFPLPAAKLPERRAGTQVRPECHLLPALPHQRPGGPGGRSVARGHLRPLQLRPFLPAGHQPAAPPRRHLRPRVPQLLPLPAGGGQPVPPPAQGLLLPAPPAPPAGAAPGHPAGGRP
ncbi:receptor for retinol uptake STRA6 isoform X2 [Poecile atricapillus]|uniref:receptor for retinol uptake STRA6 isoform X2 n=1 Tax=Poecile atricapillus TaxID=48891 RepID=UPI0027392172|nr:receptor for retinol uptake STRA6 isoform X2 [Poecile atricapillus]